MSRWSILAALSLIRLSFGYQFESMATLAPAVSAELGLGPAELGTLIGLYWAPGVLIALPGGWLGRRFGEKPMVLLGGALTVAGGLLCALGDSYGMLAAGRLLAGLGGIVMNVLAVKMTADWFVGREIGLAMGVLFGSFPLGIGLGLALQAPLAVAVGWQAVMVSTAVLAALVILVVALVYDAPAGAPAGEAPAARGLLGRREIALMTAAGIGLALYNGSFLVYVSYAPALLLSQGLGIAATGLILAAASVVSTFCVPLGGYLADRTGRPRAVLFWGTTSFCVGIALLPATVVYGSEASVAAIAMLVGALGAVPIAPMVALPSQAVPAANRAVALGLFYTWFYLGAAICPALGGWVYERAGTPAAPIYLDALLGAITLALYALFVRMTAPTPARLPAR
jgi:predicted MFS family arabinose efflux permease